MDHASAHLMEYTTGPVKTTSLESKFTHSVKENALNRSEHLMHNKEQHQQSEYYKKLGEIISKYDEAVLFGPTDAKTELKNLLTSNPHFEKILITTRQTDKMSENQQHAFVNAYFAGNLNNSSNS